MQTLALFACTCCVVLIAAATGLVVSLRRETSRAGQTGPGVQGAGPVQPAKPHPRMDLAAGIVPLQQAIRQRPRPRWVVDAARRDVAAPTVQRADWAYYNEDMGDLSDPGVRHRSGNVFERRAGALLLPGSHAVEESFHVPRSR